MNMKKYVGINSLNEFCDKYYDTFETLMYVVFLFIWNTVNYLSFPPPYNDEYHHKRVILSRIPNWCQDVIILKYSKVFLAAST